MPLYLKNSHLEVLIGKPMELYHGTRFDHSGNILQVTLNGKHTFCTTEKTAYLPEFGFGLLNEFDIDGPQAFEETPSGKHFLKLGVGSLLKPDSEAYNFFRNYEMLPQAFSINQHTQKIIFSMVNQSAALANIQYQKVISLQQNQLLIEYQLKNNGSVTLKTGEYAHNFLSINQAGISPNYLLEFNFKLEPAQFEEIHVTASIMNFKDNKLDWTTTVENEFFIRRLNGLHNSGKWWQLTNLSEGAGMKEEVSFDARLVNLWGSSHVVSPELFNDLLLAPGQSASWWRKYTFFEC